MKIFACAGFEPAAMPPHCHDVTTVLGGSLVCWLEKVIYK